MDPHSVPIAFPRYASRLRLPIRGGRPMTGKAGRTMSLYTAPAAVPPVLNGLLNNLIAFWPGDEVAGNAMDLHINALHLTDVNTVTSNPGHVYGTARQYTAATLEYHTRPGDDVLLSMGDVDCTLACWVYLGSKPATTRFMAKFQAVGGGREYLLGFEGGATDRFRWLVRNIADTGYGIVLANTLGSPSLSTWYLVVGSHDSVANAMTVSVNNGAVDTTGAYVGGIQDGTQPFRIGADTNGNYHDGRVHPSMIWKSAAGAGGVLTVAQRTALWAGGSGLPYSGFTT